MTGAHAMNHRARNRAGNPSTSTLDVAILPSKVVAAFTVTEGRPSKILLKSRLLRHAPQFANPQQLHQQTATGFYPHHQRAGQDHEPNDHSRPLPQLVHRRKAASSVVAQGSGHIYVCACRVLARLK